MAQSNEILRKFVNRKVLLHSSFWISILMIVFMSENYEHSNNYSIKFFLHYVIAFIVFLSVSYTNIYYLIPVFFRKKRYLSYAGLLITMLIIGSFITLIIQIYSHQIGLSDPHNERLHDHNKTFYFFHVLFGEVMFIIGTTFFLILDEWIKFQNIVIKMKEVESQKMQSELQALKAQINPHFLFNTLNNIYSHSLHQSPKTPEMILKISDLMSYILYECHEETVPVNNELSFIQNYIELEKLRFEDHLDVEFEITNNNPDSKIIPLVFIPFIENAFKHVGNTGKNKPYVKVNISIEENKITLQTINSVNKDNPKKDRKEGGIGIENVRKRLELLYPDKHKLEIADGENEFQVDLVIGC